MAMTMTETKLIDLAFPAKKGSLFIFILQVRKFTVWLFLRT